MKAKGFDRFCYTIGFKLEKGPTDKAKEPDPDPDQQNLGFKKLTEKQKN